ncbi:sigma-70 family RNA polymerase sigma factor [Streptomyces daliensis]|uniref:Sigma-70 family RNA polymerase sigma factor n=1 Tax=Streptomyces daliensis TaxID=299421 RepID=A0A8T4IN44_9ACTN|nr:sigma-70 family RNA polymerase sigma factor [Streptomyces daliensis]
MTAADPSGLVAEAFEAQRDRLRAVAYRVLGSHADAEDVVQEAWMRLVRQDEAAIGNLAGWLTTVVGRISLDLLRSRQARPEAVYGQEQQEFAQLVVTPDEAPAPDEQAALADSVGLALLVVLDSLTPSERLAFVLHDMFAVPFREIGQILGKSAEATKMLASRARRKVRATDRSAGSGREQHREAVQAFSAAALSGDFEALLRVLDPDVKLTVDTPDGVVVTLGATKVAAGARMFSGEAAHQRPVLVNGVPGHMSWRPDGTPLSIVVFTVTERRITGIHIIIDPAKLASVSARVCRP